ncbi:hypothetical protein [Flavobacterium oreochromis]|uniref:hypothetical protein n=1 Tax=Flavobacterium oreochromis TaxID=2906078 RepID=UPI00385AA1A5
MAYKTNYNARGANAAFRLDVSLLEKIAVLRNDANFIQKIGGEAELEKIIQANVRARCKSCGNAGADYLKHIDEYLDDVHHFATNYHGVDGFRDVLTDIKRINSTGSPNLNVEGSAFMLRVLNEKQSTFLGKITKFEGSIDDAVNGCKYDITFNNGIKVTFGEFKSYKAESLSNFLKSGGDTYQQFTTYIGKVNSIDELHYYFDINKISDISVIKNRFKNILKANAQSIFNTNPKIFKVFDKIGGDKIEDWEDFSELLNHSTFSNNHPIFDFIKLN